MLTPAPSASGTAAPTASAPAEVIARRTCFIDGKPAALQALAIQTGDGPFQILAIGEFDESETPRLSRCFISDDHCRSWLKTGAANELTQFTIGYFVGQIPHEQLLRHATLPW